MQRRTLLCTLAATAASPLAAFAQAWPARPLKLVVNFPAGTSPDIVARMLAEPLGLALKQAVIVDNKPGATGLLGAETVVRSAPDAYTMLFTTHVPIAISPMLMKKMSYDPQHDLAPVTMVATSPNVLVVDPKLGVNTLADLVRVARERKGQLNYGSVGNGSGAHLAMELFKAQAGLDIVHVPYPGFPAVVNALLAGQLQTSFVIPSVALGQIQAGKLKALAVTSKTRLESMPDLPTVAESGYPDFEAVSWQAILAPAGTPRPLIDRLNTELVAILKNPQTRTKLAGQFWTTAPTSPEGLAAMMKSERDKWAKVIAAAGVQPE